LTPAENVFTESTSPALAALAAFDAFDISDDDDPDLKTKIMDIQRRRLVADPELAEFLGIVPDEI